MHKFFLLLTAWNFPNKGRTEIGLQFRWTDVGVLYGQYTLRLFRKCQQIRFTTVCLLVVPEWSWSILVWWYTTYAHIAHFYSAFRLIHLLFVSVVVKPNQQKIRTCSKQFWKLICCVNKNKVTFSVSSFSDSGSITDGVNTLVKAG